jgi:MFS transporter, DHA1 family, multidrug resistance protein
MLLVLLFLRIGRNVANPYLPLFVQDVLVKGDGAVRMTGIINGVTGFMTALSALTISRLGDKFNKLSLLLLLVGVSMVISLPLVLLGNVWSFTIVYAVLFFVAGGVEPILTSITAEKTLPERRGTLFGLQGTVGSTGMALAPMLGSFLSIRFSLHAIFLALPVFLLLTLGVLSFLRFGRRKVGTPGVDLQGQA